MGSLGEIPKLSFLRGIRRVVYQTENFKTGVNVTMELLGPKNDSSPALKFKEFGHGIYYLDHNFDIVGDYIGAIHEDGKFVGPVIIKIAF